MHLTHLNIHLHQHPHKHHPSNLLELFYQSNPINSKFDTRKNEQSSCKNREKLRTQRKKEVQEEVKRVESRLEKEYKNAKAASFLSFCLSLESLLYVKWNFGWLFGQSVSQSVSRSVGSINAAK
jgi:hypothetical protein